MTKTLTLGTISAALLATTAIAQEVNIYSYRQPELLKPLTDAFTEQTGMLNK